jgi:hypothetical protein
MKKRAYAVLATLSGSYSPSIGTSPTRYSAVCHSHPEGCAFDLHVLGTPPAFTLSQDQTLHHEFDIKMLRLFPFKKPPPSLFFTIKRAIVSKGIKCFTVDRVVTATRLASRNTHGGFLYYTRNKNPAVPSFPLARLFSQIHSPPPLLLCQEKKKKQVSSAPLCSCSGALAIFRGIKNPEGHSGTSGNSNRAAERVRSNWALSWLLDVGPFPVSTVRLVNAPLAQRNKHYTPSVAAPQLYPVTPAATQPASAG